jgi:hypothetical protein
MEFAFTHDINVLREVMNKIWVVLLAAGLMLLPLACATRSLQSPVDPTVSAYSNPTPTPTTTKTY